LNESTHNGDQCVRGDPAAIPGTDMATPPKLPASSRAPAAMLWLAVLAIAGIAAALLLKNASGVCMELSENPREYLSSEEWQHRNERRTASCDMAFAAAPYDLTLKVRVALAKPHEQRAEELAILRATAAQGSPEAWYWIYESYKSWDQGDYGRPQLVTRAEADRAPRC
jgi:hypothetical protein